MPFQSEKQRRYLHANHPEIAKRWEQEYAGGGLARLRQAYPTNLTVGEEMTEMGTPLGNQMAKVYDKEALEGIGAESGFFGANDQLEALQKYYDAAQKKPMHYTDPNQIRNYIQEHSGMGQSYSGIDMNLIPKDFLENKRDYQEQKSPYDLIKGDESSLNTLSDNRYVDSGMFETDATYVDDTNQGGIDTIDINEMADVYSPYENYGQFFRNQPTDERTALTGIKEGIGAVKDIPWNKAGDVIGTGWALANDAMPWGLGKRAWDTLTSGFSGGEPRDPDFGRGLSGNVSWAGQQYDKQHGVGAYKTYNLKKRLARLKKSKSTSDWNRKQRERVEQEIKDREAAKAKAAAAQVRANIQTYGRGDRPDTGMNRPGGGKGQSPTGGNVQGTPFAQGGLAGLWHRK